LKRVWNFGLKQAETIRAAQPAPSWGEAARALRREVHSLLKQIHYDYERMQYNTVVSGTMKLLNALESFEPAGDGAGAAMREGFGIL
ncbi:hypothetical protein OFP26_36330, partial [Escherichia coli]|nr:hypothetical protein [Escherichia coli]